MKIAAIIGALSSVALVLAPSLASAAPAGSSAGGAMAPLVAAAGVQTSAAISTGMTIEDVAAVFRNNGLNAEISQDGGEPVIYSEIAGFNFALFGFGCASGACNEFLFSSYFDPDKEISLDAINAFNEKTVAGRAFLDEDGDPNVEHLFTVSDGADEDLVERNLAIWESVLIDFAEHIQFFHGAAS
ncbi:MAG: YbjN domain-containing protein [Pseudomonadota bacterium]